MEHLCYYGCGREATIQLKNGRWCCSDLWVRCPASKSRMREIILDSDYYKNCKVVKLRERIEKGEEKCTYCGEKAVVIALSGQPCCTEKATECPNYHNWLSNKRKKLYKTRPELIEMQRKQGFEIQNREDVKIKKSETMLQLHRGDCEPCKEFQKNYKEGRKKFKKTIKKRQEAQDG